MEQILEKIGQTKSQKLVDDCYKIYKENLDQKFPKYFETNNSKMCAVVTTTEKNEVKGIGMSKLDDILVDNWGIIFGAMLDGKSRAFTVHRDNGDFDIWRIWGGQTDSMFHTTGGAVGTFIKVGSGITTPLRTDFNMETFVQQLISGNGAWSSGLGKVSIPASASSGFTFTLSETGLFFQSFAATDNFVQNAMISHDAISPTVAVTSGQTINVDYNLVLS